MIGLGRGAARLSALPQDGGCSPLAGRFVTASANRELTGKQKARPTGALPQPEVRRRGHCPLAQPPRLEPDRSPLIEITLGQARRRSRLRIRCQDRMDQENHGWHHTSAGASSFALARSSPSMRMCSGRPDNVRGARIRARVLKPSRARPLTCPAGGRAGGGRPS